MTFFVKGKDYVYLMQEMVVKKDSQEIRSFVRKSLKYYTDSQSLSWFTKT